MFYLSKHIYLLERNMYRMTHIPTMFEYYSALYLSRMYKKPFYVYRDVLYNHKEKYGFPIQDKGIDVIDHSFRTIVQVKYYKEGNQIQYKKLSTFLATPLLVGRSDLQLILVRPNHCTIHSDINKIISRGDLIDIAVCPKEFISYIKK